ncbi:MAG: hypothetical protein ACOCUH_03660 [Bacteriovoracia bacterium]
MKIFIFLICIVVVSFVYAQKKSEKLSTVEAQMYAKEGKEAELDKFKITDVEKIIEAGEIITVVTKQMTKEAMTGNAKGFFPDNIVMPVAPGVEFSNVKDFVTNVTFQQLRPELQSYLRDISKKLMDGYAIKEQKVVINSEASSVAATSCARDGADKAKPPGGYSCKMVDASYSNPMNPTNQELAKNRGLALKYVLIKFIFNAQMDRLKQKLSQAGDAVQREMYTSMLQSLTTVKDSIDVQSKVGNQRKIEIKGLSLVKDIEIKEKFVEKIPEIQKCGKMVKESGRRGTGKGPHGKYMITYTEPSYTAAIATLGKGEVEFYFDAKIVPDRAVVTYGDKVVVDTGYIGELGNYQNPQNGEFRPTLTRLFGKDRGMELFKKMKYGSEEEAYDVWGILLKGHDINVTSSPQKGTPNSGQLLTYKSRGSHRRSWFFDVDGSASHIKVYIYGPLSETQWDMRAICSDLKTE